MAKKDNDPFTEGFRDLLDTVDANLTARADASLVQATGKLSGDKALEAAGDRAYSNAGHVGEELHRRRQSGRAVNDPHQVHKDPLLKERNLIGPVVTKATVDQIVNGDKPRGKGLQLP